MKLAFSTNAYKQETLEGAIESIAGLGYAGVELMADVPHAYPRDMDARRIGEVRKRLEKLGVPISNVNAFTHFADGDTYHPTWIEEEDELVRVRVEHTKQVIRMAGELGGRTISLQPGGPLWPEDAERRARALEKFRAGLEEVLPVAEACGVMLLVEPEPGLLIQRAAECVEFLRGINHPQLKMNADLGHFFCVGDDPAAVVKEHAAWIGHVHLEDIGKNRVHQHLVPGQGGMDWAGIFAALRAADYAGWLTVELYPFERTAEEAAREAERFLRGYL
ncbi:MAG TPA: sugar phosphate isomerase/epimerase [Phycisphaerae bacterium]|nr:sugar phosphate isomerase/epimerase [Phycisphaerae bacterium]